MRARGITAVSGSVVGDESYFDAERTAPGWKPSFAKVESPLLSALVVDRGLLDGAAVDHPALAAAILFTRALRTAGVSVSGPPAVGTRALEGGRAHAPSLAAADDAPLPDGHLERQLHRRDAAQGARRTAGRPWQQQRRRRSSARRWQRTACRSPASALIDGSGLSSLDRLTARSLAAILETVWHEPELRPLLDTFAVAGSTGTLRHRLLGVPGHQLVRGKTGTTDESSALAGFVGARYAFVVLNNGSPVDWQAAHLCRTASPRLYSLRSHDHSVLARRLTIPRRPLCGWLAR